MNGDERIGEVKAWWNRTSDSDWYRSLRTEERIGCPIRYISVGAERDAIIIR